MQPNPACKSGPETLTLLRRIVPSLPVVFVTGDTDSVPDVEGVVAVVSKPFGLMKMNDLVRKLAGR